MTTTTLNKTAGTVALTHQAVTHPDTVKGSAQDVSTKLGGTFFLFHSSVEATANTNPGNFLIQTSGSSSGDEDWVTAHTIPVTISTADTEAMTATEPVGETVLACASTTGFVAGDILYIQNTTVGNGEWARCQEIVTNTSINLIDGLTNEQTNTSVIWNDADVIVVQMSFQSEVRVRVVFQHEGATGANCHVKALLVTADSANTVA